MQNGDEASTSISPIGRGQFVKQFSYLQHHDDATRKNAAWMNTQHEFCCLLSVCFLPKGCCKNKPNSTGSIRPGTLMLCHDSDPLRNACCITTHEVMAAENTECSRVRWLHTLILALIRARIIVSCPVRRQFVTRLK